MMSGLTREAVAQPAGQRRGKHIEKEQRGCQRAHLLVGGVEFALDQREFAGQDVAVDVVEQVESDKQQQRPLGGAETGARTVWCVAGNVFSIRGKLREISELSQPTDKA